MSGSATCHEIEPKFRITPPPAFFIPGATACAQKNRCRRFTAMRSSQYSGVTSGSACRSSLAALFTSTSKPPSSPSNLPTVARSACTSFKSQCSNRGCHFDAPSRATSAFDASSRMSTNATRAPCLANPSTSDSPIPEPPPVINTRRSRKLGYMALESESLEVVGKPLVSDVNRLRLSIELDRGEPLLARAVARAARAAERHVMVDARGRQIDHHHARAHVPAEVPRYFERRRNDTGGQAERAAVRDLERVLVTLRPHDARHRPEHLFVVDPHRGARVGDDGRRHEVAAGGALDGAAAGDEPAALVGGDLDVAQILRELSFARGRSHLRRGIERVPDLERSGPLRERRDEPVVDAVLHDDPARRRAALAGLKERAVERNRDRAVEIRVVEHHEGV